MLIELEINGIKIHYSVEFDVQQTEFGKEFMIWADRPLNFCSIGKSFPELLTSVKEMLTKKLQENFP